MARRCDCHGECGGGQRRRVCADPDLTGRCRAEDGQLHPRSLAAAQVRPDPDTGRDCCGDCWTARTRRPVLASSDFYELFPQGAE